MDVDAFMRGFDQPGRVPASRPDPTSIWAQIDALKAERIERNDPRWVPPGRDPECVERLVEERWARQQRRAMGRG